ncbi:MAG TPA: hypothetical protein H9723_07380, partial [Candidatus Mediterraneibacter stercoravium]|nr:hypothetical protein [Candidatus Mediterraneibacter stercoravium]
KFTMANLSFMYVLFETFHLSNVLNPLYTKARWGTTKKRIKRQKLYFEKSSQKTCCKEKTDMIVFE